MIFSFVDEVPDVPKCSEMFFQRMLEDESFRSPNSKFCLLIVIPSVPRIMLEIKSRRIRRYSESEETCNPRIPDSSNAHWRTSRMQQEKNSKAAGACSMEAETQRQVSLASDVGWTAY